MRKKLLRYWYFYLIFSSAIIAGIFVYLQSNHHEDKHIIDVKNNPLWLNLCSEITEYYQSASLDSECVHERFSVQCHDDILFDIYPGKPFPKRSENYYIHFLNKGIIYCKIADPIPYLISYDNKQASFFESEKAELCKWSELQKLIDELKTSSDKNIIISAVSNFDLHSKHGLIKEIFDIQEHKEAIMYYSHIFICPRTSPSLPDWLKKHPHELSPFKEFETHILNQAACREELMKELVKQCNEHPEETACYLLEHGYLLKPILQLQEPLAEK